MSNSKDLQRIDQNLAEQGTINPSSDEAEQKEGTFGESETSTETQKNSSVENNSSSPNVETNSENNNSDNTQDSETEQERPLNQPKGNRPPRKTREERGLPPLDEHGNAPTVPEEKGMTLMEHLGELRTRLVRCFIAIGLAFVVCYTFAEPLFAELCKPLIAALPEGSKLIFTALPEAFFVYVKVGFVAAIFLISPYLFYQIWGFISPGLYEEEKKYMVPMALISATFFYSGASFCFFVVFPYAFTFFVGFASEQIAAMPSLNEYLGFSLKLLLAFGLIFEMPLFTFFLARMGVLTAPMMRKARRYAILCIFILAAILTPPDVISQVLMAVPMMLLYEMSIGVAAFFGRKKKVEDMENPDDVNGTDANTEAETTDHDKQNATVKNDDTEQSNDESILQKAEIEQNEDTSTAQIKEKKA